MKLKAVIIDDEIDAREVLNATITNFCENVIVVGEASGVAEGLNLLNSVKPDILFLDIQMQDGTGFDLLDSLLPLDFKVIFVTAYDKYAIQAFKYSALDYVLKPVSPMNLMSAVKKYVDAKNYFEGYEKQINLLKVSMQGNMQKIAVPTSDGVKFLKIDNIIHCKSDGSYTLFHLLSEKPLLVTRTLKEYAEILPDQIFFRIHKSHLVNINYVEQYVNRDGAMVVMENSDQLPIARNRKDEFLKALNIK